MTPVLTFFNNKSGVGKTSLVYHAAWMLSELDRTVLVVDLDPQANLTAAFLDEDALAELWDGRVARGVLQGDRTRGSDAEPLGERDPDSERGERPLSSSSGAA